MPKPNFPHKPDVPSVHDTVGAAIARSRGVPDSEHLMTQREIVEDILSKLSLPESIRHHLKKRHGLLPKPTIIYGLLDEADGTVHISFPDAPRCTGHGLTRETAIENGALRLSRTAKRQKLDPRTAQELSGDHAVKLALRFGMELVAVPL